MLAIWILAVRLVRSIFKKTHLALSRVQFFFDYKGFTEHQSEQKRNDEEAIPIPPLLKLSDSVGFPFFEQFGIYHPFEFQVAQKTPAVRPWQPPRSPLHHLPLHHRNCHFLVWGFSEFVVSSRQAGKGKYLGTKSQIPMSSKTSGYIITNMKTNVNISNIQNDSAWHHPLGFIKPDQAVPNFLSMVQGCIGRKMTMTIIDNNPAGPTFELPALNLNCQNGLLQG